MLERYSPRCLYRLSSTAAKCLLLILLVLPGTQALAQDSCVIQETITKLGSCRDDRYAHVEMTSMSKVTGVTLSRNRGNCSCQNGEYFIYEDKYVVAARTCRGDFVVTGIAADCEQTTTNNISQVPLFLTQQSEPNVMFLLDDSGSMQFEIMPDKHVFFGQSNGSVIYLFPRADDIYGGSDYSNHVATVDDVAFNAITRSPQNNTVYYNPGITYEPWTKHDGSQYPDASITCALHNPEKAGTGASRCRDLTATNSNYNSTSWHTCSDTSSGSCSSTTDTKNFWPATYFWQTGTNPWNFSHYTKVEIKSSTSTYSGHDRTLREDCADADSGICTYAEEIQNFANWYTYYRSRILAARGGIGLAFAQQGPGMRVGFGTLNQGSNDVDNVTTSVIDNGVRFFKDTDKQNFFDNLYGRNISAVGTPLRDALDKAGQYFSRSDNRGPWGANPGQDDDASHASCRRSYTVLMTDGYWSGGSDNAAGTEGARQNNDGSDGSQISGINDTRYTYTAGAPFSDSRDNTLADIAMHYWKRDLRTDVDNNVAPLPKNPAFWQHMTTYGVGLGVEGTINPDTAFAAINSGAAISWPDPATGTTNCSGNQCPARIDDLLHASLNSRGGFFSAADPNRFSAELAAVLQTIAVETKSSASSIATNSTRLDTGTLIYQARFNTRDWSSQLIAFDLNPDGSLKSTVWNTDTAGKIPAHGSRNVFTATGPKGDISTSAISFTEANWDSLSAYQKTALQAGGSVADGKAVLNWLRGDQTNESASDLRVREKILGDIINSDPFFVGSTEDFGFSVLPGTEGSSYTTYRNDATTGKKDRRAMLYVGGNDGMLHGFDALTGVEQFGFVPLGVYDNLAELSSPDYEHRYYVDGSPRASDAYLNSAWKTVLVGSLGAGGRSVYALDVTDPDNMGASKLLWEFATDSSDTHQLGVAMSNPVIARLKAGDHWGAIFGNGYNVGGNVKLMIVNLATGALLKAIDTGVSSASNGLASVVPVDTNNDRITDLVYAGDLKGNLWKFDLSGNAVSDWDVAINVSGNPVPLFKAVDGNNNPQAITSRPVVGNHETSGLMVYFGTGKYFETDDGVVAADPQIQDFYGIRDQGSQVVRSDLVTQTIVFEGTGTLQNDVGDDSDNDSTPQKVRVVSNNSANTPVAHGWRLNLLPPGATTGTGERVVSRALLRSGRIIFTSNIPDNDPCGFGGDGWLMEVDANNGGRLSYSVFDINDDTLFTEGDYINLNGTWVPVSGLGHNEMIKTPGIVGAGEREYKYTSGSSGSIGVTREKSGDGSLGRQSWRQLQ